MTKTRTLRTYKYSVITDETNFYGITSIVKRDHRGYWLADVRYGGKGWNTRAEALRIALSCAR